ncbi:MAG: hypothetical protein QOE86_2052 [Solirubrobacteraceae bacterium]|nr:hypothetical protein [Solirubrobacteraceae bacterium]
MCELLRRFERRESRRQPGLIRAINDPCRNEGTQADRLTAECEAPAKCGTGDEVVVRLGKPPHVRDCCRPECEIGIRASHGGRASLKAVLRARKHRHLW